MILSTERILTKPLAICFIFSFALAICVTAQNKTIPRDTTFNISRVYRQISKGFPMAVVANDSMTKDLIADRNIVYATLPQTPYGDRSLHLDVFRPAKRGLYPAVIMIHGGGWRSGTPSLEVPMAQMLAAKGFVTITVEYQLLLEAVYPAAVFNIKSAIRYIKANASKYGIDTSKMAISGTSAGGQLASLVGLTNGISHFEGDQGTMAASSKVQAIIDIDGVIDFMAPNSLNLKRQPDSPDIMWLGGSFEQKPLTWKEASPIFWATEKTTVPILFINSGFSRFHAGQDELIGMMQEWKIYSEVHKFNVQMHPFWLFHPWVDDTVEYMSSFLHKILR